MSTLITVIHVLTCVFLVILVLVQSGKGAEISASFGGSSQTVFGSSGGANFFVKLTGALAAIFFVTSLALTIMGGRSRKSLFEASPFSAPPTTTQPAKPILPGGTSGAPITTQNAAPNAQSAPQSAGAPAAQKPAAPAEKK